MKIVKKILSGMLISMVKGYRLFISPLLLPGKCRYIPTCSEYFIQAVEKYGPFKGSWLGIKRILRCNPFHEGGYDPLE